MIDHKERAAMDRDKIAARISGCYIPMPTLFHDGDLELNLAGMRRHVRFLLDGGVRQGNGVLLVGGAAGEFTSLSTEERLKITEAVVDEAAGRVGVIMGVQSTNMREVLTLTRGAARLGAVAVQAAPPFYHHYTDDDIYEFLAAVGEAADIGLVLYTTYWQGKMSLDLLERLAEISSLIAFKWAAPGAYEYEKGLRLLTRKRMVIDNQLEFVQSHMLGARGINTHPSNYWPDWGVRLWGLLEAGQYREGQESIKQVISPYYDLACEIEEFTGAEGHLDKLCLELVGLDSSRSRPPCRDIRPKFRARARRMLQECGVPRLVPE
jgi:4-hydroxy-tetrahydrodipicolinate synthase